MKFNKITIIDNTGLKDWAMKELQHYSNESVSIFNDYAQDDDEIIRRISNSDCILVSWKTQVGRYVIENCNNLKYIGMCCSLYDENSANVNISCAREKGIIVKGVNDYGDIGLIEYIVSELISLFKGLNSNQWRNTPAELSGKKFGIIGLGNTGLKLAVVLKALGMEVFYFNRSRKLEAEDIGIKYLPLNDLLREVDVISTHLPKKTCVLNKEHFDLFGKNKILINTSIGLTFEKQAFIEWIQQEGSFAILDSCGMGDNIEEFTKFNNIIFKDIVSGWTSEAFDRLSSKVLENIDDIK